MVKSDPVNQNTVNHRNESFITNCIVYEYSINYLGPDSVFFSFIDKFSGSKYF